MAWYRTSTINLTNGSTAVVGTGTDFISGAAVGEGLQTPDGRIYEIASIQSATSMTLGSIYLGSTASAQPYTIVPTQSYIRDLAIQASTLVNGFATVRDGAGSGKFDKGTLALPGISFVGDSNTGIRHSTVNADGTGALTPDSYALVANGVDQATVSASGLNVRALTAGATAVTTLAATGAVTGSNLSGVNTGDQDVSAMVTLTGGQTLTNKTLTSPTINGFSGTGNAAITGNLAVTGMLSATGGLRSLHGQSTGTYEILNSYYDFAGTAVGHAGLQTQYSNFNNSSTVDVFVAAPGAGTVKAVVGSFSSTGLAVTGTVTATDQLRIKLTSSPSATLDLAMTNGYQVHSTSGGGFANTAILGGGQVFYTYTGAVGAESYTERMRLDASGNLGIGVTPSAWVGFSAVEQAAGSCFSDAGQQYGLAQNGYVGSSGWAYKTSGPASFSLQSNGNHTWFTAPSGTAGNPITFTVGMQLAQNGNLAVTGTINTGGYTVATLPAGLVGQRAYVTDATSPTYNGTLTGGGSVCIPVFRNATAWVSA